MYTFKQYIREALDKPYPVRIGEPYHVTLPSDHKFTLHRYHFTDKNGNGHQVNFMHHTSVPDRAEVSFHPERTDDKFADYDANGLHGHHAVKIMSSVGEAMRKFAAGNPHIKTLTFTSDKVPVRQQNSFDVKSEEGSRNKLYRRFTKMAGGETHESEFTLHHSIPVNRDKE